MLFGKTRLMSPLKKAAQASAADQTLITVERSGQTTLRFAGGAIRQNFHEEDVTVWVKVLAHGQTGVATTSSLKHSALMKAIESAIHVARLTRKQTGSAFHTAPSKLKTPDLQTHFPGDGLKSVGAIVQMIRRLSKLAEKINLELAGSFVTGEAELCVAGSQGLAQYQPFSLGSLRLVPLRGKASGFAAQATRDLRGLEPELLFKRATDHCKRNRNPKIIRLGSYDVLLEPEAVAELVEWLSYIAFGAKELSERTSCLAGRIGEKLMHPKISIWDDGADPTGLATPFDYEGVAKQRVPLIQEGCAQGVVYDNPYASLYHRNSTGHALPFDQSLEGPLASHLFMEGGTTPHQELLRSMKRGLWITRFHYVNGLLDTQKALMTGLTRDGTYQIQNGKVVGAVKNLRFTQSVLEAFSKVVGISQERRLVADPASGSTAVVAPALLIRGFNFTGQTK